MTPKEGCQLLAIAILLLSLVLVQRVEACMLPTLKDDVITTHRPNSHSNSLILPLAPFYNQMLTVCRVVVCGS